MSFNLEYNFGNGKQDLSVSNGAFNKLNSYARVLKIEQNTVTIDTENLIEGEFEIKAGEIAMIHVSATNRTTADFLGKYLIAKIILVSSGGVVTFDKNIEEFFSGVNLDFEYLQLITFAQLSCLKLKKDGILRPQVYNPFNYIGGILCIMCYDDFIFDGQINLVDCGIPYSRKNSLRPLTTQETAANGESDFAKLSGQENFITAERFLLNCGDGAAFIIAKNFICSDESRIGNPSTHGAACCRGHKTSVGIKPSNITNIGGSTILIAAGNIQNFTPKIISKYRRADLPEGRGLARCYIASNSVLPVDEGLYSFDVLSNKNNVRNLGVEYFGRGTFGDFVNPTLPCNNYAKVTSISQNGYRLGISNKTLNGLAAFKKDSLILAQGKTFTVARILSIDDNSIIIDKSAPADTFQIISLPEFHNLTINQNYNLTRKFENGIGGVLAVAVADTFNLENGKLNVEGKGGAAPISSGNSQMFNKLPIGAGAGSIFILAKKIILNENSRIGSLHSGAGEGGRLGGNNSDGTNPGGGYSGAEDENNTGSGGGFLHGGSYGGLGGSGFSRGTHSFDFDFSKVATDNHELDGAHIFIIADKIENFALSAISTGGKGAAGAQNGAAGYGGGGNSISSGGDAGGCFIYVNGA